MDRFENDSMSLVPGQRVRVRVTAREVWGVMATILGHEGVGASIDVIAQFGRSNVDEEDLRARYPEVGAELDAVVEDVRSTHPPAWVRLSIRPEDLAGFRRSCDFCGTPTVLSPGGDGLVLDARSNDGPGRATFVSHRTCLVDRVRGGGERARAATVGIAHPPPTP